MAGMTDPDVIKLSCHESRNKTLLPWDLNSLKRLVAVCLWGLWILQNHEARLDSVLAMIVHRYFTRTTKFHILYSQTVQFLGNGHMPPWLFLASFGFNWIGLGFAKPKASAFSIVVFLFFYVWISRSMHIESRAEKGLPGIPNQRSLQLLRASENIKFDVLVQNMQTDIWRPLNRELSAYSKANLDTAFLSTVHLKVGPSKSWTLHPVQYHRRGQRAEEVKVRSQPRGAATR